MYRLLSPLSKSPSLEGIVVCCVLVVVALALLIFLYVKHSSPFLYEGFKATSDGDIEWTNELIDEFLQFQNITNPTYSFDIEILKTQVSPSDVQDFMKNGRWKWSTDVKSMYKEYIATNQMVAVKPEAALDTAQKIYNETAIKELMAWDAKEGVFLLNGTKVDGNGNGNGDGVENEVFVRCGTSLSSNPNNPVMEKITTSLSSPNIIQNIERVESSDLPSMINGFTFYSKESGGLEGSSCNPCGALNDTPDYSCPFSINNVEDGGQGVVRDNEISVIWKNLWGLSSSSSSSSNNIPEDDATSTDLKQFPILSKLKKELNDITALYNPIVVNNGITSGSGNNK